MRYFICISSFLFIFSSCKDKTENYLHVFKIINEGLEQSNQMITSSNDRTYQLMEQRLEDPQTRESMKVWLPLAIKAKEISDSMINYIKGLKEELVNESGPVNPEDKEAFDKNETVVDHVFQSHGRGKELFEKLVNYRKDMLSIDPGLNAKFKNNMVVFSRDFDQNITGENEFIKAFFGTKPAITARVMLGKFENNIKVNESNFANFCNSQMCILNIIFDSFTPLVSVSSSYVKAGDDIEINAGVGAFTTAARPRITINNISVAANENGLSIYRFKAPAKSGKYQVPIEIEFLSEDGTKQLMTKTISYTVLEH